MIQIKNESQPSDKDETDHIFQLKNLDNGEVTDIRSDSFSVGQFKIQKHNQSKSLVETEYNPKNNDNWTAFWQDLNQNHDVLCRAAQINDVDMLRKLLRNALPLNINKKRADQWCALHFACFESHTEAADLLLGAGADPNITNIHLKTSLHIVCIKGSLPICKMLINAKASLNVLDQDKQTPIHYASYHGHLDIVQLLIEEGADLTLRNSQGLLPVDLSIDQGILNCFNTCMMSHREYQRQSIGPHVLNNGRQDHVLRLLKTNSQPNPQPIKEVKKPDNKPLHRMQKMLNKSLVSRSVQSFQYIINDSKKISSLGPADFQVFSCLGKGSFGHVYLVKQKGTERFFAMKVLSKLRVFEAKLTPYAQTERNVLSMMNCPFIVKLNYAFQTENKLYLIMDYCPGGDLEMLLFRKGVFKESLVKFYVAEIVLALEQLHTSCIIFRDLKPSNIVIDSDGHACLTDFGLSKCDVDFGARTKSFCGTLAYLAPEMLDKKGHGYALDWYHLGVLTYELLDGYPPYYDKDKQKLFHNIKKAKLVLPPSITAQCANFIECLLERNPQNRLGSRNDATEIKEHPFFADIDWKSVSERKLILPKPLPNQFMDYEEENELKITFSTQADSPPQPPLKNPQYVDNWSFIKLEQLNKSESQSFRNLL